MLLIKFIKCAQKHPQTRPVFIWRIFPHLFILETYLDYSDEILKMFFAVFVLFLFHDSNPFPELVPVVQSVSTGRTMECHSYF